MAKSKNNIEELKAKREEASAKFSKLREQGAQIDEQINRLHEKKQQIEVEKFRLQGEHRILTDLIGDNPDEDPEELPVNQEEDGNDV